MSKDSEAFPETPESSWRFWAAVSIVSLRVPHCK